MTQTAIVKAFAVALLIGLAFGYYTRDIGNDQVVVDPADGTILLRIGEASFDAEVADTFATRVQGLSNRKSLPENRGLLFVFEEADQHGFWMKDMLFSIDIIWISEDKKVVHVEENVSPDTYPNAFAPSESALYVFEINAGEADKKGIKLGDEVQFSL